MASYLVAQYAQGILRYTSTNALAKSEFESWAVLVDKTTLSDPFKVMSRLDFYLYFVTELIRLIPESKADGATLILDEFGSAAQLPGELRRFMKIRNISRKFKHVLARRSSSEPLIQVADLVAGAVARRDTKDDASAYDSIEGKLKGLLEFRD